MAYTSWAFLTFVTNADLKHSIHDSHIVQQWMNKLSSNQQLQRFLTLTLHLVEIGFTNIDTTFLSSHTVRVISM